MAAANSRPQREVIEFAPNVSVTLALKYSQGKLVSGMSGERVMFSTVDGRIFFCDPSVAGQIEAAGINVRENFTLTQHWDGHKDSPRTWEVAKLAGAPEAARPAASSPAVGQQRDGTFVVPAPPKAASAPGEAPTAKPPQRAANATTPNTATRSLLVQEADALVDAYALVLERALTTYQGRIKPDEVRSLLLSAYIQRRQLSTVAAA